MRNLLLEIEYDGTRYGGWQVQNRTSYIAHRTSKKSIQEIIEKVLHRILQEKVSLIVSGRTDAGVHAKGQAANFSTKSAIELRKLQYGLNSLLPKDISISSIKEVSPDFHSRFNAKSKIYCYTILNSSYPCALLSRHAYYFPHRLNLRLMRGEAKALVGRHDFKSFQASTKEERSSVRRISKLNIVKKANLIYIYIEGSGFLYNMARNIVGTLIEVGRGRFKAGSMKRILEKKDRRLAGPLAAAKGLCLMKVEY